MTSMTTGPGTSRVLARASLVALWAIVLVAFAFFAPSAPVGGLLFELLGVTAVSLMAFAVHELRRAARTSAIFWEGAARNAWMVGALASLLFFVRALGDSSRNLAQVARDLALAFLPAVYGLALAGLCAVRALRLRTAGAEAPPEATSKVSASDHWLGAVLFTVLVVWTLVRSPLGGAWRFAPWEMLLHWPAVLVVAGAAVLVAIVAGAELRGRIGVVALVLAGALASLGGLVLVLLGFADQNFPRVVSGVSSILTACFVALVGMLAVANPIEDRRMRQGGSSFPSNRTAWMLFPVATLFFLVIVLVLAMTPMPQRM
jgi:hypothetical protein